MLHTDHGTRRVDVVRRIRWKRGRTMVTTGIQQRVDPAGEPEGRSWSGVAGQRRKRPAAQRHAPTESDPIARVTACPSATVSGPADTVAENAGEYSEAAAAAATAQGSATNPSGKTL